MNCDFVKTLTAEQKAELKKLLEEEEKPQYRVVVETWNNGKIKSLTEYLGDQLHGKSIKWYGSGNKWWESEYQNGQLHGKSIMWWENGNKEWEIEYQNGKEVKQ